MRSLHRFVLFAVLAGCGGKLTTSDLSPASNASAPSASATSDVPSADAGRRDAPQGDSSSVEALMKCPATTPPAVLSPIVFGDATGLYLNADDSPPHFGQWTGDYPVGDFAGAGPAQECGDRGVMFARDSCGTRTVAACAAIGSVTRQSCLYLVANDRLTPAERQTTPAGTYFDEEGGCWELTDATIEPEGREPDELGGTEGAHFSFLAVKGATRQRMSGFFTACVAVKSNHTCR